MASSELYTDIDSLDSAQRNTYLTGFCLFLSLVLTRTFSIILDLLHTQEEYAKLKKAVSLRHPRFVRFLIRFMQVGAAKNGDQTKQIEELKKQLAASEAKDRDFGASRSGRFVNHQTKIPQKLSKSKPHNRLPSLIVSRASTMKRLGLCRIRGGISIVLPLSRVMDFVIACRPLCVLPCPLLMISVP